MGDTISNSFFLAAANDFDVAMATLKLQVPHFSFRQNGAIGST